MARVVFINILLFIVCISAFPQVVVSDNTQINIYSGTTVNLNNDTLYVNNSLLKNHGQILLSQNGYIVEKSNFPIFGQGYEFIAKKYNASIANENIGGFGLLISTTQISDSIKITRGHTDVYPSQSAILRWYEISPKLTTSNFVFTYDDTELNGLTASQLTSYNYELASSNWISITGVNTANRFTVSNSVDIEKLILTDGQLNGITVFPNPGFNELIIANLPFYSEAKVKLFSVEGKLVRDKLVTTSNYSYSYIDIDGLAPGLYIVTVTLNNGDFYSKKWIKR